MNLIEMAGGRKFVFALLAIVLGFVMVMTGATTAKEWMGFVELLGGIYVTGNVVSKFATGSEE